MKTVIRDRSAQSIPLPFTVASVGSNFFWIITGCCRFRDHNIIIPSALGFFFGMVQLTLKLIYSYVQVNDDCAIP
jgi:hypothetical protein